MKRHRHPEVHTGLPAKTPCWEPVDVFKHKKKQHGGRRRGRGGGGVGGRCWPEGRKNNQKRKKR